MIFRSVLVGLLYFRRNALITLLLASAGLYLEASVIKDLQQQTDPDTIPPKAKPLPSWGSVSGNLRYLAMATAQHRQQMNAHAQAVAIALKYKTPILFGFDAGIGGAWIQSLLTSDLAFRDPLTGARNRYEIGLFDQAHYIYKSRLFRPEHLYLRYTSRAFSATAGRYAANLPFINEQDGRMRPTLVQGLSSQWRIHPKWKADAGWLQSILPRGGMQWLETPASVGVYAAGKSVDGQPAGYTGNFHSDGIVYGQLAWQPFTFGHFEILSQTFTGVMHHASFHGQYGNVQSDSGRFQFSMRLIRQDAMHQGQASDAVSGFINRGQMALIGSGRIAGRWKQHILMLNYTRITGHGKFLMPREWGREPFYTFIPRERLEGAGDVHAVSLGYENSPKSELWFFSFAVSGVNMPSVYNTRLNTYALGNYVHMKWEGGFYPDKQVHTQEIRFMVIHKRPLGHQALQPQHILNKVKLWHFTLTLNYYFDRQLIAKSKKQNRIDL